MRVKLIGVSNEARKSESIALILQGLFDGFFPENKGLSNLFSGKKPSNNPCSIRAMDSDLRASLETPISFTLMVHHVVLYKLKPEVTPARVEAMMMNTRMQLLKIPEVLNIKCGIR